jgi:hypothetical protein
VLARRLLLLVAVLMGLTVLATGVAPPPPTQPVRPATPTPSAGSGGASSSQTVQLSVDATKEKPQSIAANSGDVVHITVRAGALDTVEIVGLDLVRSVAPESPAEFDLLAPDGTQQFPIMLVESGRRAGTLQITGSE